MRVSRFVLTGVAFFLAVSIVAPVVAQSATDAPGQESKINVLLTFRMGTIENGQRNIKKSYQLVVAEGHLGSKLLSNPSHYRPRGEVVEYRIAAE